MYGDTDAGEKHAHMMNLQREKKAEALTLKPGWTAAGARRVFLIHAKRKPEQIEWLTTPCTYVVLFFFWRVHMLLVLAREEV